MEAFMRRITTVIVVLAGISGCKTMNSNPPLVNKIEYNKLFTPPNYFNYRLQGLNKREYSQFLINIMKKDALSTGLKIDLYKVIPKDNILYFVFYIKDHQDLHLVYAVSKPQDEILYKFEFSSN